MRELDRFKQIWLADFEFRASPGDRPVPICLVARELRSGRTIRWWEEDLAQAKAPPYACGTDALFVAYYASAELGCHLALGWPLPDNVLDLFAEFRVTTNVTDQRLENGLLNALQHFGLFSITAGDKEQMRNLALRGGPWSADERTGLLEYCESDVTALASLLGAMGPKLDLDRALIRGRYMKAAARVERTGVPMDVDLHTRLVTAWPVLKIDLIKAVDANFGVFDGTTFKAERWASWLREHDMPWPTEFDTGRLKLDDDTFTDMARVHPEITPLKELRASLSQMRLSDVEIGSDGRNRTLLSAFKAKTGRNQPGSKRFIFGPAVWMRGLIKPQEGNGLAYVDWSQQEFGIAAALSSDLKMQEAYRSGDPYLTFAKQAGALPASATKESAGAVRDQFKAAALAVQYGMGDESLSLRLAVPTWRARELLEHHRRAYPDFWRWSDAAVDVAMLTGVLQTTSGWPIHVGTKSNPRMLANFPMQGNGAEMLRLACCFATEAGVSVCAPVHDALPIEAPLTELDSAVAMTKAAMTRASRIVLGGFELRSDVKLVRYPDRYADARGSKMWATVMQLLLAASTCSRVQQSPLTGAHPHSLISSPL